MPRRKDSADEEALDCAIHIRVPKALHDRFSLMARENGMTLTTYLRLLLRNISKRKLPIISIR